MFPRFLRPLAGSLLYTASAFAEDAPSFAAIKGHQFDLLVIGDSITHNLDKPGYKAVWEQFFAPRKAIGLGYSGG